MTAFDPYHVWLGLPQNGRPFNHYELLGLQVFTRDEHRIAQAAEIRLAHVRQFASGELASHTPKILSELLLASRCLLNPTLKDEYDRRLRGQRPSRQRWSYLSAHRVQLSSPPPLPSKSNGRRIETGMAG